MSLISQQWPRKKTGKKEIGKNDNTLSAKALPWPVSVDYLIIVILCILLISMAPLSAMVYDTARSLSAAYQMTNAQQFPLQGPVFAGVLHFGPVWYYFLSIPLFFGFGVMGITLWCKFWFAITALVAYKLGAAMPGYQKNHPAANQRAFGLCLVGLLFSLGWHSMTTTIMAHTMYQWLCVLVSILFLHTAIKCHKPSVFLLSGLFFSLALHAHPTALILIPFYAYLAIVYAYIYGVEKQQIVTSFMLFIFGFLIPFLPYLIDQNNTGWPDFSSATQFLGNSLAADDNSNILSMFGSIFIKGPVYAAEQFSMIKPELHALWTGLIFLTAIFALFKQLKLKQALILLALFLLMTVGLIKIKTVTHFYMTFSHWLVISIIAAYVIGQVRYSVIMVALVLVVALSSQVMALYRLNHTSDLGYTEKPADLLADIDTVKSLKYYRYPYMDNLTRVSLARHICEQGYEQVQLGGALALLVELSGGIEYDLACDRDAPDIFLLGLQAEQTLIGLTNTQAKAKGGCYGLQIRNICLERPSIWQQVGDISLPIADPKIYPPRQRIKAGEQSRQRVLEWRLNKGEVLLLSNPLIAWMPWEITDYDEHLQIIYQDEVSIMLRSQASAVVARISLRTNMPDYIQVSQLTGEVLDVSPITDE